MRTSKAHLIPGIRLWALCAVEIRSIPRPEIGSSYRRADEKDTDTKPFLRKAPISPLGDDRTRGNALL